jgi:hypothetical protein
MVLAALDRAQIAFEKIGVGSLRIKLAELMAPGFCAQDFAWVLCEK